MGTDSQMESRMTGNGGDSGGGRGIDQKRKKDSWTWTIAW